MEAKDMSIRKQYTKDRRACKVTFLALEEPGEQAREVHLAGDFNQWDTRSTPMKRKKDGSFAVTLSLEPGRAYQYRYVVDNCRWVSDLRADDMVHCSFGNCDNSVAVI